MVRYFFHVMGGNLPIEDDDGTLFSDTSDAVAHGAIVANDLANDDQYDVGALAEAPGPDSQLSSAIAVSFAALQIWSHQSFVSLNC